MSAVADGKKGFDVKQLIRDAANHAVNYLAALPEKRVFPSLSTLEGLARFSRPLQDQPLDPAEVLDELNAVGSPAAVAGAGGRYFGFVVGSSLPAALAANILAAAWDQNAVLEISS